MLLVFEQTWVSAQGYATSDRRLKERVSNITDARAIVRQYTYPHPFLKLQLFLSQTVLIVVFNLAYSLGSEGLAFTGGPRLQIGIVGLTSEYTVHQALTHSQRTLL